MLIRTVTGLSLVALLAFALYMGGLVFSSLLMAAICLSIYEIYRALKLAGYHPVQWPSWVCVAVSVPAYVFIPNTNLMILFITCACFLSCTNVLLRGKPVLEDVLASALPLFSVLAPGMCILGLMQADTRVLQTMYILMCFGIPLLGDTLAYFIGSRYGTRKLCPLVSPKKSVEGAIAGLFGSILFGFLSWLAFGIFETVPPLWHFLILGLVAGVAGQIGDLYASLIKRRCGIKDFGTIFPGHGGMMDRLDSTYFAAVVVYIYYSWLSIG